MRLAIAKKKSISQITHISFCSDDRNRNTKQFGLLDGRNCENCGNSKNYYIEENFNANHVKELTDGNVFRYRD